MSQELNVQERGRFEDEERTPTIPAALGALVGGSYAIFGVVAGIRFAASELWPGAYGVDVDGDRGYPEAVSLAAAVALVGLGAVLAGTLVAALRGSTVARWIAVALLGVVAIVAALIASQVGSDHRCVHDIYAEQLRCTEGTTAYVREALLFALPAAVAALGLASEHWRTGTRAGRD